MINIKYFILLCATCYTAKLNMLGEQDIVDLWNTIKTDGNDFVIYENFVIAFEGDEKDEFLILTKKFGTKCKHCGVFTMNYNQFKKAALQGLITIGPIAMLHSFFDAIARKKNALYITIKDLEDYYGTDYLYTGPPIDEIKEFGGDFSGEWRLFFDGFKEVINFGLLMDPYESDREEPEDLDLLSGVQVLTDLEDHYQGPTTIRTQKR